VCLHKKGSESSYGILWFRSKTLKWIVVSCDDRVQTKSEGGCEWSR